MYIPGNFITILHKQKQNPLKFCTNMKNAQYAQFVYCMNMKMSRSPNCYICSWSETIKATMLLERFCSCDLYFRIVIFTKLKGQKKECEYMFRKKWKSQISNETSFPHNFLDNQSPHANIFFSLEVTRKKEKRFCEKSIRKASFKIVKFNLI